MADKNYSDLCSGSIAFKQRSRKSHTSNYQVYTHTNVVQKITWIATFLGIQYSEILQYNLRYFRPK